MSRKGRGRYGVVGGGVCKHEIHHKGIAYRRHHRRNRYNAEKKVECDEYAEHNEKNAPVEYGHGTGNGGNSLAAFEFKINGIKVAENTEKSAYVGGVDGQHRRSIGKPFGRHHFGKLGINRHEKIKHKIFSETGGKDRLSHVEKQGYGAGQKSHDTHNVGHSRVSASRTAYVSAGEYLCDYYGKIDTAEKVTDHCEKPQNQKNSDLV